MSALLFSEKVFPLFLFCLVLGGALLCCVVCCGHLLCIGIAPLPLRSWLEQEPRHGGLSLQFKNGGIMAAFFVGAIRTHIRIF